MKLPPKWNICVPWKLGINYGPNWVRHLTNFWMSTKSPQDIYTLNKKHKKWLTCNCRLLQISGALQCIAQTSDTCECVLILAGFLEKENSKRERIYKNKNQHIYRVHEWFCSFKIKKKKKVFLICNVLPSFSFIQSFTKCFF